MKNLVNIEKSAFHRKEMLEIIREEKRLALIRKGQGFLTSISEDANLERIEKLLKYLTD